jgi:hypothetical protein
MATRLALAALAAAALVTVGSAARADDASAGREVTFGVQPATDGSPDGRPNLSWGATPGGFLSDHVALLNYTEHPIRLNVYATDAYTAADGGYGLLAGNQRPADAGSWIKVSGPTKNVRVPAATPDAPGQRVLAVTAQVPANATPGDHDAGILAVLTSSSRDPSGAQVRLDQRVGTRVFIRVAGDTRPALTVRNLQASYHGSLNPLHAGSVDLTYTLVNTGNVNVAAVGSATVSGLFGSHTVNDIPKTPLLTPGGTLAVKVTVPGIWPQVWMKGSVEVVAAPVANDTLPAIPPATASASFWAIPWALLLALLIVVLAAGAWWWRRRHPRQPSPVDDQPTERSKAGAAQ